MVPGSVGSSSIAAAAARGAKIEVRAHLDIITKRLVVQIIVLLELVLARSPCNSLQSPEDRPAHCCCFLSQRRTLLVLVAVASLLFQPDCLQNGHFLVQFVSFLKEPKKKEFRAMRDD